MTIQTPSKTNLNPSATMTSSIAELTVLYGSETGNAEYLAHQISETAEKQGIQVDLDGLDEWVARENKALNRLLVVTSTHDNGHMPSNAETFWQWLNALDPGTLDGLPYAVLSIGDSMYEDFCKAGQDIDQQLMELGAEPIIEPVECDVDFEFTASDWYAEALEAFESVDPWEQQSIDVEVELVPVSTAKDEVVYSTRVTSSRVLSGSNSTNRVIHFELESIGEPFEYLPGDTITVYPMNTEKLVSEWLNAFAADGATTVSIAGEEKELSRALREDYELSLPHPGLILSLANLRPDNELAQDAIRVIEEGDRETLEKWLWDRDVLDVIKELDCLDLPIQSVLSHLRPMQQRDYSISSSPMKDEGSVHITVSALQYESHGRIHYGTASSFLEEVASTQEIFSTTIQSGREFSLPDTDAPVIMIGPGVGMAPFRSFLRHREACSATGDNWFFFGAQQRTEDYLYGSEVEELQQLGVLTKLNLAFSRDQAEKHYVQHELHMHADEIRQWLDRGAYVFICGDKARMARDVDRAIIEILADGQSAIMAGIKLAELKAAGRYVKDVY